MELKREMQTSKIAEASDRFLTEGEWMIYIVYYICVSSYCDEKIMHAVDKLTVAELRRIKYALWGELRKETYQNKTKLSKNRNIHRITLTEWRWRQCKHWAEFGANSHNDDRCPNSLTFHWTLRLTWKLHWLQPRSQGPLSSYLEKVPWLRLVTCLLDFSRFQRCDSREGLES